MNKTEKKKVTNALSERSLWIRVGWLPVLVKPLTLSQIYDMGEAASEINGDDLKQVEKINMIAALINHAKDARALQDVFLVCAFRKKWKRWLFGRYIRNRLNIEHINQLITIIATTFNINFFLTSIIFLTQTKIMTEPSQMTALGQSSEE